MRLVHSRRGRNHRRLVRNNSKNFSKVKRLKSSTGREEIIDGIIKRLNISEDVINGAEIISLVGKRNLVIENYLKVIEYELDKILIKTKRNYVLVEGNNLKIEYLLDDELRITGKIDNISFVLNK